MTNPIRYEDYEGMINKLSWRAHAKLQRQGVAADIDDLKQEGASAFMRAVEGYKPETGFKFSTYLWTAVQNAHKQHAAKVRAGHCTSLNTKLSEDEGAEMIDLIADESIDATIDVMERNQEREASFRRNMASVSCETRAVIIILIRRPDEVLKEVERCRAHSKRSRKLGFAAPNHSLSVEFICNLLHFTEKQSRMVKREIKWIMGNQN